MTSATLAYEGVPQRFAVERGPGSVRISLPVDAASRRAMRRSIVSRVWTFAGLGAFTFAFRPFVTTWPKRFLAGFALALGLNIGGILFGCGVAWCVGWIAAARLRPVTVDVGGESMTVTCLGRRPRVIARGAVRQVRVARFGRSASATVHLFGRFEPVVSHLWYGPFDEIEAAAAALRLAIGLPADERGAA